MKSNKVRVVLWFVYYLSYINMKKYFYIYIVYIKDGSEI